jgi:hypothetical protein
VHAHGSFRRRKGWADKNKNEPETETEAETAKGAEKETGKEYDGTAQCTHLGASGDAKGGRTPCWPLPDLSMPALLMLAVVVGPTTPASSFETGKEEAVWNCKPGAWDA